MHHETKLDPELAAALSQARDRMLARLTQEYDPRGYWPGRLSSSALSTAVATFALSQVDLELFQASINRGLTWLIQNANPDGGWGDTSESPSNLSTTLLGWCALSALRTSIHTVPRERDPANTMDGNAPASSTQASAHGLSGDVDVSTAITRAEDWLKRRLGDLRADSIQTGLLRFYGQDRTFSAPILTVCALSGRLGVGKEAWDWVPQLPFELSALPRGLFKWLHLQVVSYALPALIAIGLVRFQSGRNQHTPRRWLRHRIIARALRILEQVQPESGGFLEAIPLTAFVVMSLAAANYRQGNPVVLKGTRFLQATQRADGSWPIDSNLATWLTTLVINQALAGVDLKSVLNPSSQETMHRWLLQQQHRSIHPFTQAAPGGWAWTDLSGGVPDADDTAGALLALARLGESDSPTTKAAADGARWLLKLQNADGGVPTFCRGWGKLPFDRSCPGLTAHALRAVCVWEKRFPPALYRRIQAFQRRAIDYLVRAQKPDGSWAPLWFGNQHAPGQCNLTYGTAQVLLALNQSRSDDNSPLKRAKGKAIRWLIEAQNVDGSWGGAPSTPGSIEETTLALSALAEARADCPQTIHRAWRWWLEKTHLGTVLPSAPIGLYFASLWYDESLYPLIFSLGAVNRFKA
jgi:squalene-hopene/tetraprenyl-beta-curcumene cyclase